VVYGNAIVLIAVAIYFFALPTGILIQALNDPAAQAFFSSFESTFQSIFG
jgi:hypothetical protein